MDELTVEEKLDRLYGAMAKTIEAEARSTALSAGVVAEGLRSSRPF
jgi:hypothetical protein